MAVVTELPAREDGASPAGRRTSFLRRMRGQTQLILMSVPIVAYVILFSYYPIWGWTMAFQQFRPGFSFWEQEWVGLKHFRFLFGDAAFLNVLRNTVAMSLINMVLGFVTAISFAILLNEVTAALLQTDDPDDLLSAALSVVDHRDGHRGERAVGGRRHRQRRADETRHHPRADHVAE